MGGEGGGLGGTETRKIGGNDAATRMDRLRRGRIGVGGAWLFAACEVRAGALEGIVKVLEGPGLIGGGHAPVGGGVGRLAGPGVGDAGARPERTLGRVGGGSRQERRSAATRKRLNWIERNRRPKRSTERQRMARAPRSESLLAEERRESIVAALLARKEATKGTILESKSEGGSREAPRTGGEEKAWERVSDGRRESSKLWTLTMDCDKAGALWSNRVVETNWVGANGEEEQTKVWYLKEKEDEF